MRDGLVTAFYEDSVDKSLFSVGLPKTYTTTKTKRIKTEKKRKRK